MEWQPYLERRRARVEQALDELLPVAEGPAEHAVRAMRYAVQSGGKRLRPVLVVAACEVCGGDGEQVLEAACGVEFLHTYSLIHDDLPSMDDDDLRRGKPTVHRAFGEAVAILAGDALQTLAFEVLASRPVGPSAAPRRLEAVLTLARAGGVGGLIGGQVADLETGDSPLDEEALRWIHRNKTGALFAASAEIGAIHAEADSARRTAMRRFGRDLGLAFQIIDDVLDRPADAASADPSATAEPTAGRTTFLDLFGADACRAEARRLVEGGLSSLASAGLVAGPLEELARQAVDRDR